MKIFDQKNVSGRFAKLPEKVQDTILGDEVTSALSTSIESAGLKGEQAQVCNQQATMVLVGLQKTAEFEQFARTELELDAPAAEELVRAMWKGVFGPVQRALLAALDTSAADEKTRDGVRNAEGQQGNTEGAVAATDPYREPVS